MANPVVIQNTGNDGPGATQTHNIAKQFASKTTAGNGLLAFGTMSDFAGTHTDIVLSDSGNFSNTAPLDQENSSPTGGAATLCSWAATNIVGDPTTADTLTQGYVSGSEVEDFMALYIVEVANCATGAIVGHSGNTQNGLAAGTNNVNSGTAITVSAGQLPALMVAMCFNTSGAGSHPTPTSGGGMSPLANTWAFGTGTAQACVATQLITSAGTYQAVFNQASSATEDMVCTAVILQGIAGTTPAARTFMPGPGVQPGSLNQFRASPRGFIPPVSALAGAAASGFCGATASMFSLQSAGGLGFVSQPGPGVGPFSNNQFQISPRAIIAAGPQFLMAGAAGSIASGAAALSALQSWAASGSSVASGASDLATQRASGGRIGYLTQPGPGVGPFSNSQFATSPRSTQAPFSVLVGAASALAQTQGAASLATAILLATDVPGAVMLLTEGGSGLGIEGGGGLLVSSPMRGPATATASLSTGTNMAGSASAVAAGSGALTTAARMNAAATSIAAGSPALLTGITLGVGAGAVATGSGALATTAGFAASAAGASQASGALLTGITLAATVSGFSYASGTLGTGTSLTVTAAGMATVGAALLTQTLVAASGSGFGSASAQLGTASQLAAVAACTSNASGGLSASIVLSAQATGSASASPTLAASVIVSASAAGFASAQGTLATGTLLSATAMAAGSVNAALSTSIAPYSALGFGSASASANLNGNVVLVASAGSISSVTARLLTVLQPPGEFADIRWLRAPRGAGVAYAEFFQGVGEQLWYGVNWEDWLASNWEANSSATLNQALRPTIPNGLEFINTQAGQTGAVEPIWPTYAGGVVVDGTAMWQGQAVSSVSLDDTISGSAFSAPTGIALDSGQVLQQRSYLIIESPAAVIGTDYDVLCTIYTTGGQQKIAKLRIKVR